MKDNLPKQHANLKFLECENAKQNSKRALRAGTKRNNVSKWSPAFAILFNDMDHFKQKLLRWSQFPLHLLSPTVIMQSKCEPGIFPPNLEKWREKKIDPV